MNQLQLQKLHTLYDRASAYKKSGFIKEAIIHFNLVRKALEKENCQECGSLHSGAWFHLGDINRIIGRYATASDCFKKCLLLNKSHKLARVYLEGMSFSKREGKRLEYYRNRHVGEECWMIGNGPSLNKIDLTLLKGKTTFVFNGFVLHKEYAALKPTYFVASNKRLMTSRFMTEHIVPTLAGTKTTAFLDCAAKQVIRKKHAHIHYLYTTESPLMVDASFNIDITQVLFGSRVSVLVQAAIPLALYMGFKKIYLVGVDCDYYKNKNDRMHFYKESSNEAMAALMKEHKQKFASLYKDTALLEERYAQWAKEEYSLLRTMTERLNVEVINCTSGGKLDVFRRENFEVVLGVKKAPRDSVLQTMSGRKTW